MAEEKDEVTGETKFTADYKNGKSTITVKHDGVSNIFPVVMYSEQIMEKVRQAQEQIINEKKPVAAL